MSIVTVYDQRRGCGDRKEGGMYLMGGEFGEVCGRMPFELTVCPCCGFGVKPSRGWTWLDTAPWVKRCEVTCDAGHCPQCPLGGAAGRWGLIWIGEKFYKTPHEFIAEAGRQKLNGDKFGISRRLPKRQIPKGFEIGKTWVLLAHRNAIAPKIQMAGPITVDDEEPSVTEEPKYLPGIFSAFRPDRIEYVTHGTETDEEIEAMERRGITCVKVIKLGEQTEAQFEEEDEDDDG